MVGRGKPILGDPSSRPTYTTGVGQKLTVHAQWSCIGDWCVIHRPMPGPWESWPTRWRYDRRIMERVCPCGVGHPAAEEALWCADTVHGCCGIHTCTADPLVIEGEVIRPRKELGS
jgi:hypothetical protein